MTTFDISPWIGALFSIAVFSYLWKDNIAVGIVENIATAITMAQVIVGAFTSLNQRLTPVTQGRYTLIIAFVLGALLFTQLSKRYKWIARYPNSLTIAMGLGVVTGLTIRVQILGVISSQVDSILKSTDPLTVFSNWLLLLGLVTTLSYWIFTVSYNTKTVGKPLEWMSRIGRLFIMLSIGFGWGNRVIADIDQMMVSLILIFKRTIQTLIVG